MSVSAFTREVRLAAKLIVSGASPPRLRPNASVVSDLGIDERTYELFREADVVGQVALVTPLLNRRLQTERASKAAAARRVAERHAAILMNGARRSGDGLGLPVPPLIDVAASPAFKVLLLDSDLGSWSFPRLKLRRVLYALKGCNDVKVELRGRRLFIGYNTQGPGRGQFVLLDQQVPVGPDVFVIRLGQAARLSGAGTTHAKGQRRPLRLSDAESQGELRPRRSAPEWLRESAELLLDAIASR